MSDENPISPPPPPSQPAQPEPPVESFAPPTPPPTPPPVGSFPSQAAPPSPYTSAGVAGPPKQSLSLTSFILGVAGLVFSWVLILGFLASLAAIILGFIGKAREPGAPKWMWLIGIITGFVAIFISIIVVVFFIIGIALAASTGQYVTN